MLVWLLTWLTLPLCRNLTIQHMSRVWHQPSQVSRTNGCSKLEHGTSGPLFYCDDALLGVRNPTKIDFQSPVQPCLVSAIPAHTLCNYSSDLPLLLWVYKGGSHYWEGHPAAQGPTVQQLSHTVFFSFATRYFINLCCNKQDYFKKLYIKKHMQCLNFCNDFLLKSYFFVFSNELSIEPKEVFCDNSWANQVFTRIFLQYFLMHGTFLHGSF